MPVENCSTQLGEGKQLPKGSLGVYSRSITSCRVGTWESSAVGSSPMPTKLSEHVTRLMHMAPEAKSLKQAGRHHGGPYHLNGILVFGPLQGNAANYPWWAIPHAGTKWSLQTMWGLAARLYLSWHDLLGQSGFCGHLGCGSSMWPWPSPTMVCWEGPSWTSSVGSAVATFSLSGFCQSGWHDFHPVRGWDIF